MNKPISSALSAPVRNRPDLSIEEIRGEVKNPPVPPQAVALMVDPVPLEVRRLRVQNGSKRKRDLAAVRMAEELELLEKAGETTGAAEAAWSTACERLASAVPPSTFALWIEPLAVFGADGETLILTSPEATRAWTERRYSSLISEALEGTEFAKVRFVSGGER